MSKPSPLTTRQIKQLTQVILQDKNADARKTALLEIRHSDDPRVNELLEHVSRKDANWQVRDLAKNLLTKKRILNTLENTATEFDFDTLSVGELATDEYQAEPRRDAWKCSFCDAENDGGERCPSCGADRPMISKLSSAPHQNIKPDEIFYMYKGNRDFVAGKKKNLNTQANGCLFLFFIPFIVVGFISIGMLIVSVIDWQTLNTRGITTLGTYTERFSSTDSDGDTTYTARYQFLLGDTIYSDSQSVSYEFYNRVETGARVDILYDPLNPGLSVINGHNDLGTALFFVVFGCIWNAIIWPMVIGFAVMALRDRRLAREGTIVNGHILKSSSSTDSDNDFKVKIEYTFKSPDNNQPVVKTESRVRNDLKKTPLPAPNTPVMVVYRNAQHFRLL